MVPFKEVKSSLIASHGYEPVSRTLGVRFNNSALTYLYRDVPPEVAERLEKAESIGKAFGAEIRGKFEHTVIPTDDSDDEIVLKDGSKVDIAAPWKAPA